MIALCLFGDKELLSGNAVRAVARPAPQRQLERSQAPQLAFGRLDRGLDVFFGDRAPIRKHDAIPSLLSRSGTVSGKSDNFGHRRCLGDVCVDIFNFFQPDRRSNSTDEPS